MSEKDCTCSANQTIRRAEAELQTRESATYVASRKICEICDKEYVGEMSLEVMFKLCPYHSKLSANALGCFCIPDGSSLSNRCKDCKDKPEDQTMMDPLPRINSSMDYH